VKQIIIVTLFLFCWLTGAINPSHDFNARLNSIVKPYRFSLLNWELSTTLLELRQWAFAREQIDENDVSPVLGYFNLVEEIKRVESEIGIGNQDIDLSLLQAELSRLEEQRDKLKVRVEHIIERQLRVVLTEEGIFNPLVRLRIGFPPVNFVLGKPPYRLIVSHRDRIEPIREIDLNPDLSLEQIQNIETSVDKLNVSSLIEGLGGISTYPSLIANDADLRFTLNATAEEWLHQYLTFRPLGFIYLLDTTGIRRDYDIATMNETVASMIGKEIGTLVYEKYYAIYTTSDNQTQPAKSEFDFNHEMREIRRQVDDYLAQGKIEEAERFMEERRQYIVAKGYYIRKLNQAYFAFHGTYADSPTSISPIGVEIKQLRSQSASIKHFLDTVSDLTSRQALRELVQ
jgi:hypothetical protein